LPGSAGDEAVVPAICHLETQRHVPWCSNNRRMIIEHDSEGDMEQAGACRAASENVLSYPQVLLGLHLADGSGSIITIISCGAA